MQVFYIIFFILLAIFLYLQNNLIDVTEYNLEFESIKDDFRIVHLSDFHSRPFGRVLKKVRELKPDYICITGDYINDKCKNKDKMLDYAIQLVDICPVYYISGNHEKRLDCFDELMEELSHTGFNVIINRTVDAPFGRILGLVEEQGDFSNYKDRRKGVFVYPDMSGYFNGFEGYEGFRLLLSHYPENFREIEELNYSQYNFDLQLSGHAHGGQWIMPFIGPLFSPGQGVFPKYAKGAFGDRPKLIVSRGLGNSEFPFRLFNHPEIVVINLHKPNKLYIEFDKF